MKKIALLLLSIFIILLSFVTYAQEKWDYPIKPKTEEWKKLESKKAKVEACQVPEHILRDISTNDLTTLCLQYPLLYDVFAFENINRGLDILFNEFNGIREFAKRKEVLNCLREKYIIEIQSFSNILNTGSLLDRGNSVLLISMLEYLLSYSGFYTYSSQGEQIKVLETLLFGYKEKFKYSEKFKGIGFISNLFARAHVISKIDNTLSKKLVGENSIVLYSGMADENLINTIDSLSYYLIK